MIKNTHAATILLPISAPFLLFLSCPLSPCASPAPPPPSPPPLCRSAFYSHVFQGSAATKAFSCCHYNYSLHTSTHTHTHACTHSRSVFVSARACTLACTVIHKKKGELFLPLALLSINPTSHPPTPSSLSAASHICYAEHRRYQFSRARASLQHM